MKPRSMPASRPRSRAIAADLTRGPAVALPTSEIGTFPLEVSTERLGFGRQDSRNTRSRIPRLPLLQVRFGRPGRALNRPTWSPVKGSSASLPPIAATVVRQRFFGIPATDTDIISGNTSGRAGWKRLGPVVTMRSRSLGRRVSECWLWARFRHAAIVS